MGLGRGWDGLDRSVTSLSLINFVIVVFGVLLCCDFCFVVVVVFVGVLLCCD